MKDSTERILRTHYYRLVSIGQLQLSEYLELLDKIELNKNK
tara:strand:- start:90787 stop:90909 length:123 start_codon:yes stop_codon:yes gene_type:complete